MKKVLLTMVLSLVLMTGKVYAEDFSLSTVLGILPPLKQGIAYSITDSKINYLSTMQILKYKNFALEAGYAGAAENTGNKIVGVVSYEVLNLKEYGVELPVLDLIEFNVGLYAGYGRIQFAGDTDNDNEFDYGVSATLLNVKW